MVKVVASFLAMHFLPPVCVCETLEWTNPILDVPQSRPTPGRIMTPKSRINYVTSIFVQLEFCIGNISVCECVIFFFYDVDERSDYSVRGGFHLWLGMVSLSSTLFEVKLFRDESSS